MTLSEAERHLTNSRNKLASYGELAASTKREKTLEAIREEIVRLEIIAQNLPSRATKIHRLIQAWRRCHAALWLS
ncbi:hypothetical protein [Devosia submarina]|uniref:hypothetical protein n=1 Tax=Devosia submarina TaxID=1173082 RepID=UPI000D3A532E|nr:hypothetical protein [Devosia submarina]